MLDQVDKISFDEMRSVVAAIPHAHDPREVALLEFKRTTDPMKDAACEVFKSLGGLFEVSGSELHATLGGITGRVPIRGHDRDNWFALRAWAQKVDFPQHP